MNLGMDLVPVGTIRSVGTVLDSEFVVEMEAVGWCVLSKRTEGIEVGLSRFWTTSGPMAALSRRARAILISYARWIWS